MTSDLKKINVCRIIYEFLPATGGSITHTIELANHMAPYCNRQFFIVPEVDQDTTIIDSRFTFEIYRVKTHKFRFLQYLKSHFFKWLPITPLVDLSFSLAALKKCLWLNKKHGIDIIHAHGIPVALGAIVAARLMRKTTVLTLDGTLSSYSKISGYYEALIYKITNFDHYFVVDNGGPAVNRFKKLKTNSDRFTPVSINIDSSRVYPRIKNLQLLNYLGWKAQNKFIFISVHNLEPIQGVDYSILGFNKLIKQGNTQNTVLLIVGGGPDKEKLENLVNELEITDKVIFVGRIENSLIPEYYSISNVALSTSIKINMNLSTIEAMACKMPVVAFDCGNTSDLLISNMNTGILVKPGSIEELAKAMRMLYDDRDLGDRLGIRAREFIVNNRDWGQRIKTEVDIYAQLLKQQKRH
jgi:glycosyltransferase involved in cell wall biosynthesis